MLQTVFYDTDLCVVGGGIAGICAAVAAAREGVKVVLMHERPMLGGNASSEIRMWVCGSQGDNCMETGIMEEMFMNNLRLNPDKTYPMFDAMLYQLVTDEPNITLLLNCSCMDAATDGNRIVSVTGWQMTTQRFCTVRARYFADCSGDSILAPLTGAEFRMGREAASEFGEKVCTEVHDRKTMGNSCLIQARKTDRKSSFTAPDFALKLTPEDVRYRRPNLNNDAENFWYLELGGNDDTIGDAEVIRDRLIALAYGMWDYVKNSGDYPDADYWELSFIGFLPGKRESRRMVGKVIVNQNDIIGDRHFEDVAAYGGWSIDDHDPDGFYRKDVNVNRTIQVPPAYAIPYRCLYSNNIENLFFAGRNISMTHSAMSSARVMATCGVCGQAVGTAAAVALRHGTDPDGVYRNWLGELQDTLQWNDCFLPHRPRVLSELTTEAKLLVNGKESEEAEVLRDGDDRNTLFECEPGTRIEYRFDGPKTVNGIRIIFDSDLRRKTLPGSGIERHHMTRCNLLPDHVTMHLPTTLCSSFVLGYTDENGNDRILVASDENYHRLVNLTGCEGVTATSVYLVMNRANCGGETMRLFSFDVK